MAIRHDAMLPPNVPPQMEGLGARKATTLRE